MSWVCSRSRTAVGVDFGTRQIKAAQLRAARNQWHLEAVCVIPRNAPGATISCDEVQELRYALDRQGFTGRDLVVAAADEKLLTGILELPAQGKGASRDQIARMELARMHKVQPNSFEMSYWALPATTSAKSSTEVMAVGCRHDEANRLLDAFESASLNVRVFDVGTCALARACRPVLAPEPGSTAILDIGWSRVSLLIICCNVIAYERVLPEAGVKALVHNLHLKHGLDAEVAERLVATVGFADQAPHKGDEHWLAGFRKALARHFSAVVQELQAPFSYIARQYGEGVVGRVLLAGGGACIPDLDRHLNAVIQQEVIAVRPADIAECSPSVLPRSSNAALTAAIGLAQFREGH